jgi:hypothetical protein
MRLRIQIPAVLLAAASAGAVVAQSARPQSQHSAAAHETSRDLLNQINSCDTACADQLARAVNPQAAARQKQSLSYVVEKSKQDQFWQALLAEAIAVQSQSCESNSGKGQEANASKDEKETKRRLADVAARAAAHINTISDAYVEEFMRLQLNRIWNAPCTNPVAHIPSRRDPEDIDAQKDESATNDPPDDNR